MSYVTQLANIEIAWEYDIIDGISAFIQGVLVQIT